MRTLRPSEHKFLHLAASLALILAIGCSKGPARPKTVPAGGKVLYKGLPVEGATVAFLGDGSLPPALGRTDSSGRFELTTSEPGDGAVPGTHTVTVSKSVPPKLAKSPSGSGVAQMESIAKEAVDRGSKPPEESSESLSLLPKQYSQAATSKLSFEVTATGKNDFEIKLED